MRKAEAAGPVKSSLASCILLGNQIFTLETLASIHFSPITLHVFSYLQIS